MLEGNDARYILTDHLGTPQKMTDEGQQVVWSLAAEPFGKTVDIKGGTTLNLRFPGQYFDAESTLNYNINRSYIPGLGRYTQADPIGLSGGINRYAYTGGNPVNRIDPFGLDCLSGGGLTSCSDPGGPRFNVPSPPNVPTTINVNTSWKAHNYHTRIPLGGANPNDVFQNIINNPAPGAFNPASFWGTPNAASIPILPDNPIMSYITTDLNTGNPLVVNFTSGNSFWDLSPGYVAQEIIGANVEIFGEGEAWEQALPGSNNAAKQAWQNQINSLIGGSCHQ